MPAKKAAAKKAAAPTRKAAPKAPAPKAAPVDAPDAEAAPWLHQPATNEASPFLDHNPEASAATMAATADAEKAAEAEDAGA